MGAISNILSDWSNHRPELLQSQAQSAGSQTAHPQPSSRPRAALTGLRGGCAQLPSFPRRTMSQHGQIPGPKRAQRQSGREANKCRKRSRPYAGIRLDAFIFSAAFLVSFHSLPKAFKGLHF